MVEKIFRNVDSETEVVSEKERILRFRVSDETPDRAGDIVRQAGIDWSRWEKNPVVLLAHNYADFPIGKGVDHGRAQRGSWVDVKFADKEQYDRAEIAYQLAKPPERYLNATSIGFIPTKTYAPENDKERKELGLGQYGVVFERSELLEVSLVSVPANPNAVGMSLSIAKAAKDPIFQEYFQGLATSGSSNQMQIQYLPVHTKMQTEEGPEILRRIELLEEKLGKALTEESAKKYFAEVVALLSGVEERKEAGRPVTVESKSPSAATPGADLYLQILGDLGRVAKRAARKETES